jgi:DNA-binding beta-propeller fold protein YncE
MGRQDRRFGRRALASGVAASALVLLGLGARGFAQAPPKTEVDPLWPKPLPNHWILGSVTGVAVDSRDHVWVVHRGQASLNGSTESALNNTPPGSEYCCSAAPFVLEFDAAGTLVSHWGGPGTGYNWPLNPGGIAVDTAGNVWITAAGMPPAAAGGRGRGGRAGGTPAAPPPEDAHVLKFGRDGKFLLQIGKPGELGAPDSKTGLHKPSAVEVDSAANEVFVADTGNRRVVVFDATTGAYKRHWGAYGKPSEATAPPAYAAGAAPASQFRTLSCLTLSRSGELFVCDRDSNRIQVFKKDGSFVKEAIVSPTTLGAGSVWDIALSSDASQRFVYVANGQEQTVHVLRRDTLAEAGTVGKGGRWPGTFFGVGSVAVTSQGHLITGENLQGKRVQKFMVR